CNQKEDRHKNETFNRDQINDVEKWVEPDTIIIDSKLSFEEAIEGSNAPQAVIDELELMDVNYISTDGKLHMGQILTNKKLAPDLKELFQFMLEQDFAIEKTIPIVAYNWSDSLSMANNNTYSFCYRNATYSKHAHGMAIDINPRFNPLRWKNKDLPNEPVGAVLDTTVNGTLHPNHPVVKEFRKRGFRWGHTFSKYWDDHHFERN
ncbi:MAG: M15 family metallopeptidase, partial [Dysgonamonadaceae bacterium]